MSSLADGWLAIIRALLSVPRTAVGFATPQRRRQTFLRAPSPWALLSAYHVIAAGSQAFEHLLPQEWGVPFPPPRGLGFAHGAVPGHRRAYP